MNFNWIIITIWKCIGIVFQPSMIIFFWSQKFIGVPTNNLYYKNELVKKDIDHKSRILTVFITQYVVYEYSIIEITHMDFFLLNISSTILTVSKKDR